MKEGVFVSSEKQLQGFAARMAAAAAEIRRVPSLVGAAMLSAVGLVLNQFTIMVSQFLEIGFSFLAVAMSGYLYGPWLAGLAGVVLDLVGYMLRPNGGFFIGFTLNEFLLGFLYGCWLYRKPVSLARTFCACLSVVLVLNFCLTPIWLHIMYGNALVITSLRLIKNCIKLPLDTALLYCLLKVAQTRTQTGHFARL
jgi:ECF transporter S component (folate family)